MLSNKTLSVCSSCSASLDLENGRQRTHLKKVAIVFILTMQATRLKLAKIPITALILRLISSRLLIETDMGLFVSTLRVVLLLPWPSSEVLFLRRWNAIDVSKKEVNAALAITVLLLANDRCVVDEDRCVVFVRRFQFICSSLCCRLSLWSRRAWS